MSGEILKLNNLDELNLSLCIQELQSGDKFVRKRTLCNIKNILEKCNEKSFAEHAFKSLHTYVLRCFSDVAESCRELSVEVITRFIDLLPLNDYYLTYIVPVVVKRVGLPETVETCEELRLKHVILVKNIIQTYKDSTYLPAFFNDFTIILSKTCLDSFGKVKIESCETIILLSNSIKQDFHLQSESFLQPVFKNFSHQQFKVRVSAINAIGAIVLNGSTKCLEESVTPVAEKLFDDMFTVRLCVIEQVGQWMLHHRDRYSFWHKMIPLLLTGLNDVHPDVFNRTKQLWNDVGLHYIEENQDQLKEKLDFERDAPIHYPPVERPNLGCRTLVECNIGKIIPAIINELMFGRYELDGWQADARLRSAQLLSWLVLYAETSILQHAAVTTRCFLMGAKNEDIRVNNEIYRASELLGYFVSPDIWWELLSPEIDNWACLGILSNIIKGTEPEKLKSVYLKKIVKKISKPDRCRTSKVKYQTYLLKTCENLLKMCGFGCASVGREIFDIIFTVLSMAANADIGDQASVLLRELAITLKFGNEISDVCVQYVDHLLGNITSDAITWNIATPERCILETIMVYSGKALGKNLHLLAPILVEVSGETVNAEVKLRLFTNLSSVLLKKDEYFANTCSEHLSAFMKILVEDVIISNLVWSAGRSAESIRTSAVFCLCAVLQNNQDNDEKYMPNIKNVEMFKNGYLDSHVDKILPLLAGTLDDNSYQTRLYTMTALCCMIRLAKKSSCFSCEHLHRVYPAVMKRMDDPNDTVRLASVQTLCLLFMSRPDSYDITTFQSHLDAVYSAMLIHLDDPSEDFGKETLAALKELSEIHPKLLKKKIKAKMNIFRNKLALESLDKHLESLSI